MFYVRHGPNELIDYWAFCVVCGEQALIRTHCSFEDYSLSPPKDVEEEAAKDDFLPIGLRSDHTVYVCLQHLKDLSDINHPAWEESHVADVTACEFWPLDED